MSLTSLTVTVFVPIHTSHLHYLLHIHTQTRYLKAAIVDKNPFVASSALVTGIGLMKVVPEIIRRWVNEIQETVLSSQGLVQFHALALLYELKKTDRLALHKVVTSL